MSALDEMEGCVICHLNQPDNREGSDSQGKLDIVGQKHVPDVFNKGKIALNSFPAKRQDETSFWQQCCVQLNTHPCHVYVL